MQPVDQGLVGDIDKLRKHLNQQAQVPNILTEAEYAPFVVLHNSEAVELEDHIVAKLTTQLLSMIDPYKSTWIVRNGTNKRMSLDDIKKGGYLIEELPSILLPTALLDTRNEKNKAVAGQFAATMVQNVPAFSKDRASASYGRAYLDQQINPDQGTHEAQQMSRREHHRLQQLFLDKRNGVLKSTAVDSPDSTHQEQPVQGETVVIDTEVLFD